jgi:hypothetical protein
MASHKGIKWVVALLICNAAAAVPAPAVAGLFGPGKFKIEQIDDRFSTGPTVTVMGQNNRISKKSIAGGVHIDAEGVYLEPLAVRNRSDGELVRVGFFLHNETSITSNYGTPNSFGIPQRIIFIIDGSRQISTDIVRGGTDASGGVSYNSIGRYASSGLRETGLAYVQLDEMVAISRARTIAIRVEGSQRAATYEERDIAKSFLPNLAAFYASQIAR